MIGRDPAIAAPPTSSQTTGGPGQGQFGSVSEAMESEQARAQERFERTARWWCDAHPRPALGVLLAALYLPWLSTDPVASSLEAHRLLAASEMLARGDWVVPTHAGEPYLAKPPLQYWLLALLAWPGSELTATTGRLLSVLSVAATVFLLHMVARRVLGARTAFMAAAVLGGSALCFEKGIRAELEAPLMAATTAAMLALWGALEASGGSVRSRWIGLSGVALGAAVLIKGPVPLVVLVAADAVRLGLGPRERVVPAVAGAVGGALLCTVPWVLALLGRFEWAELVGVLDAEVVERTHTAGRTNAEPFWFYLPGLVVALLPWSLLAPVWAGVARPAPEWSPRERRFWLWLVGWGVGTIVLLSFSEGKETRYLLPTLPALALLLAWGRARALRSARAARALRALAQRTLAASWLLPPLLLVYAASWRPDALGVVALLAGGMLVGRALVALGLRRSPVIALLGTALVLVAARGAWAELDQRPRSRRYAYPALVRTLDALGAGERTLLVVGPCDSALRFHLRGFRIEHLADTDFETTTPGACPLADGCAGRILLTIDRAPPDPFAAQAERVAPAFELGRRRAEIYRLP